MDTKSLFSLALVVAVVARVITVEDIFVEMRDVCIRHKRCGNLLKRKLAYLPTCSFCFSHWVTALLLVITRFHYLYTGWRGYIVAEFALVAIANLYMAAYERLTVSTKEARKRMDLAQHAARHRSQPLEFTK